MRLVTAVLPPHRVADVRAALLALGISGMTIGQVTGYGMEMWKTTRHRGLVFHDESASNVRLEMIVEDQDADDVINVVLSASASTSSGAGKVWVVPVERVVRVRTGERGPDAL